MLIADSHLHIASPDPGRFPPTPTGIGTSWWETGDHSVEALLARMDQAGVTQAVLVQAVGRYAFDNSYVLEAAEAAPERFSVVVAVDLDDSAALDQIENFGSTPKVAGVRFFGMTAARDWIDRARLADALAATAAAGLTAVITVPSADLPTLRTALIATDTPVVIDHCGFPDFEGGRIRDDQPILSLAAAAHISLKVTTHSFEHAGGDGTALIQQLASLFGASRLIWGSDFPQTRADDYARLVESGRRAGSVLADEDQAAFLGGNTQRLFAGRPAPTLDSVREALSPLAQSLTADGYLLDVRSVEHGVARLDVRAGAEACAADRLSRSQFDLRIEVAYPNDH
jgi:L-fuconolactonase